MLTIPTIGFIKNLNESRDQFRGEDNPRAHNSCTEFFTIVICHLSSNFVCEFNLKILV